MTAQDISLLLERLRSGDDEAATEIWEHFYPKLACIARRQLSQVPKRVADEDDVVLSAMNSFFLSVEKGNLDELAGSDELWRLLSRMTRRKAVSLIRKLLTVKRGGGLVRGDSALGDPLHAKDLAKSLTTEVTPELAAMMAEEVRGLLNMLDDRQMQQIALGKLEGRSNEEVAISLCLSMRTVERRVASIRQIWAAALERA